MCEVINLMNWSCTVHSFSIINIILGSTTSPLHQHVPVPISFSTILCWFSCLWFPWQHPVASVTGVRRSTGSMHTTNPYHYKQTEIVHLAHVCIHANAAAVFPVVVNSGHELRDSEGASKSTWHFAKCCASLNMEIKYQRFAVINHHPLSL